MYLSVCYNTLLSFAIASDGLNKLQAEDWQLRIHVLYPAKQKLIGMSLFCFFSHLLFFLAILFFSNLLCSIFCSKFQHFAQSLAK